MQRVCRAGRSLRVSQEHARKRHGEICAQVAAELPIEGKMAPKLEPDDVELATLVAGMAHEINNPITYVLGNLNELAQTCAAMAETLSGYRREVTALAGESAAPRIRDVEAKLRELGGVA